MGERWDRLLETISGSVNILGKLPEGADWAIENEWRSCGWVTGNQQCYDIGWDLAKLYQHFPYLIL